MKLLEQQDLMRDGRKWTILPMMMMLTKELLGRAPLKALPLRAGTMMGHPKCYQKVGPRPPIHPPENCTTTMRPRGLPLGIVLVRQRMKMLLLRMLLRMMLQMPLSSLQLSLPLSLPLMNQRWRRSGPPTLLPRRMARTKLHQRTRWRPCPLQRRSRFLLRKRVSRDLMMPQLVLTMLRKLRLRHQLFLCPHRQRRKRQLFQMDGSKLSIRALARFIITIKIPGQALGRGLLSWRKFQKMKSQKRMMMRRQEAKARNWCRIQMWPLMLVSKKYQNLMLVTLSGLLTKLKSLQKKTAAALAVQQSLLLRPHRRCWKGYQMDGSRPRIPLPEKFITIMKPRAKRRGIVLQTQLAPKRRMLHDILLQPPSMPQLQRQQCTNNNIVHDQHTPSPPLPLAADCAS
mmetsp:Transcript_40405/g.72811  ORF Transcript_40405/g.72811 Transcript_40405/m.72811 type:complete len:400 (+) Transcript_40405:3669-4868(+)